MQREGHLAFMGIPFATAGRWKAPTPVAAWDGVRQADRIGAAAPQPEHPVPGFAASGHQDEDCLNLNVFTPALDDARRPVMLWIHGGGFTHGAGYEPLYNGGPLARRGDVVVVTINYRLGALGYLYLDRHLPDAGVTANAGQLDQVAALQWVHDNIAAFGGDPGNVTIFGQSAGAAAVGTLLAMPAATGLFHKAIMESGTGRGTPVAQAAVVTDMVLSELGIEPQRADEILSAGTGRILEAQVKAGGRARVTMGLAFGPVIDGEILPEEPIAAIEAGRAADIPVMLGSNRDEVKQFVAFSHRDEIDDEALVDAAARALPNAPKAQIPRLISLYRNSRMAKNLPHTNLDLQDAIETDARTRYNAIRFAESQAARQPNTFLYLFTHESPARRGALGACHSLEMPFVFGTLDAPTQDKFAGTGPEVERLSANMMDAWILFARNGNPSHEGIGDWPGYNPNTRPTMVFGPETGVQNDPFGEERAAIASLAR